jgi:hypothetical protein
LLCRAFAASVLIAGVLAPILAIGGPAVAATQRPTQPQALAEPTGEVSVQAPASASVVAASTPAWLREINKYRRATSIATVKAKAAWVTGIKNHLRYMADTPAKYLTGQYVSLHTENPKSPYYTKPGAHEAAASDLFEGAVGFTAVKFIDGWLSSPFHAIGMLRPALRHVAFASNPATGDAGLDVISGLTGTRPDRGPVLFPGPGITTNLLTYSGSEEPDPLQTCRWTTRHQHGLPLIALLPAAPKRHLTATLTASTGARESTARDTICMVDEHHYHSTDPIYGPTGAEILAGDHAVLLIPFKPLKRGLYHVTIKQPGLPNVTWSFSAVPPK